MRIVIYILSGIIVSLIIGIIMLAYFRQSPFDKNIVTLQQSWDTTNIPVDIKESMMVYVSAPLFNMEENLYAVGVNGLLPQNSVSIAEGLCDLTTDELNDITKLSIALECPLNGIAGEISSRVWPPNSTQQWGSYCPARDGFILGKYLGAVNAPGAVTDPTLKGELNMALGEAIYGNDVYALSAVCNSCIFNGNGLQIDDGSAAEVGMLGERGVPIAIFRDQYTQQFGPNAGNPMPPGNSSTSLGQIANQVPDVDPQLLKQNPLLVPGVCQLLEQRASYVSKYEDEWWGVLNYTSKVAPSPLQQYWAEIGKAVFRTKFGVKKIITYTSGPKKGFLNFNPVSKGGSCTQFYYDNYYNGGDQGLINIATRIKENMDTIKKDPKWQTFFKAWGGWGWPSQYIPMQKSTITYPMPSLSRVSQLSGLPVSYLRDRIMRPSPSIPQSTLLSNPAAPGFNTIPSTYQM